MEILVANRVWDGLSARPTERGFVRVEDSIITAVGRESDLPSGTAVHDLGDVTLLPGLINAHVHITFSASATVLDEYLREKEAGKDVLMARASDNLSRALDVGVTTVRDLGTMNDVAFAARTAVRAGTLRGPDVIAAGEGITSPGGHCHFFGIECRGEQQARDAVRRQSEAGADVIKIFATGGRLTPSTDPFAPQFTVEELTAAVDATRAAHLPITSHAHASEGIRRSIAAGVDSIEHCSFETSQGVDFEDRDGEAIAERGIAVVPTGGVAISGLAYMKYLREPSLVAEVVEDRRPLVHRLVEHMSRRMEVMRRLHALGPTFVIGTDAGIPSRTFDSFTEDLELFSDPIGMGLGPRSTLVAATSDSAHVLGLDDRGVIEPGKRADLLAVSGDPLEDITAITRTRLVMAAGQVAVDHLS